MARNNLPIVLGLLATTFIVTECGGPEAFRSHLGSAGAGGPGGSTPAGAAGTSGEAGAGAAGVGVAGNGAAGDTGIAGVTGTAGTGAAGTGAAGTGAAGTGAAGKGAAGTGAAGTGAAGTGAAGMGGKGGAGGAGGMTGAGGAGGKAGTGAAGTGTPDAGTDAPPPGCNCMLKVQYQCKQDGPSVGVAVYAVKVTNTGTTPIQLNTVTVRYWYTIDGTGAQSGTCQSATHPCTIAFQSVSPAKATANEYAVISFAGGTLAPGADTGDVNITMNGTGTYNQTNDYSFASTGAIYVDRNQVTAYVSGKLMDGAAP